jgi:hypothetical protein
MWATSANFSTSGERQQDNDLIIIRDAGAERSSHAEHPSGRRWSCHAQLGA